MRVRTLLSDFRNANRAQLMLLAAVALVLLILAMITLLNAASFTALERSSGMTDYEGDALDHLDDAESGIETSIRHANHEIDNDDEITNTDRINQIESDITHIDDRLRNQVASKAGHLSVESTGHTEGYRFWQPPGELVATEVDDGPDGCENRPEGCPEGVELPSGEYGMYDDADGTRSFTLGVTGENLYNPDEDGGSVEEDAFAVAFETETGESDRVYIYENPNDGDEIIIEHDGSDMDCTAEAVPNTPAQVAFTHGLVNEEACEALPGTEMITDLAIENGESIEASMDLVADVDEGNINYLEETDYQDEPRNSPTESPNDIEVHHAIYSVNIDISVSTPHSDYESTIRIAPQLPGDAAGGGGE